MLSIFSSWLGGTPTDSRAKYNSLEALVSSLLTMAWFVEARDPYTGGHLWRVSRYSWLLGMEVGLPAADVARVSVGGFLHDLGKIAIPDAILRKTSSLTDEEFAIVRTHPELGMRMLAGHPLAAWVREAVYSHHERPDGTGYPRGLGLEEIHLDARIVGLCDAFDAMTSNRPYRAGMSRGQALAIIQIQSGSQFDPELCWHFLELGRRGELDHVIGHSDEGMPLKTCPMCGPTLVVKQDQQPGEHIYCRNCGGEFKLEGGQCGITANATGRIGTHKELEADVDHELIRRVVAEAASRMPLDQLLKVCQQGSCP